MEESWELLTVPAEIQSSTSRKETSSDCPEPEKLSEKTEGDNKSKVHYLSQLKVACICVS